MFRRNQDQNVAVSIWRGKKRSWGVLETTGEVWTLLFLVLQKHQARACPCPEELVVLRGRENESAMWGRQVLSPAHRSVARDPFPPHHLREHPVVSPLSPPMLPSPVHTRSPLPARRSVPVLNHPRPVRSQYQRP